MKSRDVARSRPAVGRREFVQATTAAAVAVAASGATSPAAAQGGKIEAQEHWAKKGNVDLYLYRKRLVGDGNAAKPVLFLVHGSTFSCRGSYDLQVPGRQNYSMMDHFAGLGFDVWSMDHEGYGHSSRTGSHAGIMVGVEDLKAAMPVVERVTGRGTVLMHGAVLGRHPRRRLCGGRARPRRAGGPGRLHLHRRERAGDRAPPQGGRPVSGQSAPARSAWPPSSASSIATSPARRSRRCRRRWRPTS